MKNTETQVSTASLYLIGICLVWAVFYLKFTVSMGLLLFIAGVAIIVRGVKLALQKIANKKVVERLRVVGLVLAVAMILALMLNSINILFILMFISCLFVIPFAYLDSIQEQKSNRQKLGVYSLRNNEVTPEDRGYDGEGVVKLHPLIFFIMLLLAALGVVLSMKKLFF